MEQLAQFGIQPLLLAAQILNFLILAYILKRFLYKPVLEVLKKREQKIKEGLLAAEEGQAFLAKAQEEQKKVLQKASSEAKAILEDVRKQREEIMSESREKAKEEAEKAMVAAKKLMDEEVRIREKELEKRVMQTSVSILERMLPEILSKDDQEKIIESAEKRMQQTV